MTLPFELDARKRNGLDALSRSRLSLSYSVLSFHDLLSLRSERSMSPFRSIKLVFAILNSFLTQVSRSEQSFRSCIH